MWGEHSFRFSWSPLLFSQADVCFRDYWGLSLHSGRNSSLPFVNEEGAPMCHGIWISRPRGRGSCVPWDLDFRPGTKSWIERQNENSVIDTSSGTGQERTAG